jgi:tetratricopeptide (TPR) repeat protein
MGVSDAQDILQAKGQKINSDLLGKALGNAALSAENDKDNASAIAAYKKGIALSPDSTNNYLSIITLFKRTKDIESAKKYTDDALVKFPSNRDLLIDKINFFLTDEKYADAITYIKKAVENDPKNEQLQAAMGVAYDQIKDTANARKVYENLLVMNPNNVEANRGIGGLIFNRAKPIQDKMNALGATKEELKKYDQLKAERDAIFLQSKPYLQKALDGKPDDAEIKKILVTIDSMTRN